MQRLIARRIFRSTGGARQGAATLAGFGLGAWPAVLGSSGVICGQISRLARLDGLYALTGVLLAVFGAVTAIAKFAALLTIGADLSRGSRRVPPEGRGVLGCTKGRSEP